MTYRRSDVARADVAYVLDATLTSPRRRLLADDAHFAERFSRTGVWRDAATLEMIGGAGRKNSGSHGAGHGRDWGLKRVSGESARRRDAAATVVLMEFAGLRRRLMENEDGRRPGLGGQMMLDVAIRWSQGCADAAHGIRWAAAEGGEQAQVRC